MSNEHSLPLDIFCKDPLYSVGGVPLPLTMASSAPGVGPSDCFSAQTIPSSSGTNPDVGGIAVALSSEIILSAVLCNLINQMERLLQILSLILRFVGFVLFFCG